MQQHLQFPIGFALLCVLGWCVDDAWGQSVPTSASTQQSLQRSQSMMQSMRQNQAGRVGAMGGQPAVMGGTATQSIQRQQAMMQAMQLNQNARRVGMQQQVIHRTPDNLQGVYWNNYFSRRARERAVYGAMGRGIPQAARDLRLQAMATQDRQLRQAVEAAQLVELQRRQQQREAAGRRVGPVQGGNPSFPGADMLRIDAQNRPSQESQAITIRGQSPDRD